MNQNIVGEERLKKRESINSLFQKTQVKCFLEFFGTQGRVLEVGGVWIFC
jgi:hypothetical protein